MRLNLGHPALAGLSGRGVTVAVIDSGVHAGHPHVGAVAGGVAVDADLREHDEFVDRLGHGTAVTAVIEEKAPGAEVYAVKVFDRELTTTVEVLVRAIDWAASRRIALVNLSLGTTRPDREQALSAAVRRAVESGTTIVSARRAGDQTWLPGELSGVVGVDLDWTCDRHEVRIQHLAGDLRLAASGYPRPAPGVPPDRNLHGVSFAVANATGLLARVAEFAAGERLLDGVRALLRL